MSITPPSGGGAAGPVADGDIPASIARDTETTAAVDAALATAASTYEPLDKAWVTGRAYVLNELVISGGTVYRVSTAHTSAGSFDATKFTAVGGGGGGPLAVTSYASATPGSYSIASATDTVIDATNVSVTFTAPSSGTVIVVLSAYITPPGGASVFFSLDAAGVTVTGSKGRATGGAVSARCSYRIRISGLTPAASYTWRWAWSSAAGQTASIYNDLTSGPALMEVWPA